MTTRTPVSFCPVCGTVLSAATSVGEKHLPEEGCFSVCITCATLLRYDTNLRLSIPPAADVAKAFREDPDIAEKIADIQLAVRTMHPGGKPN